MPTLTTNYSLYMFDLLTLGDKLESFQTFRDFVAGIGTGSNMYKIDTAMKVIQDQIDALDLRNQVHLVPMTYDSANHYSATVATMPSYPYPIGSIILGIPDLTNDGTTQLSINSESDVSMVKKSTAGATLQLVEDDLLIQNPYIFYYDGSNWVWISPSVAESTHINGTAGDFVKVNTDNTMVTSGIGIDTDVALTADSDSLIASQKATKAYADNLIGAANAVTYQGVMDCSTNPNYPAGDAGNMYFVSVAGKIGGISGISVEAGDMFICNTDGTITGDEATVGIYWNVIQKNIDGAVIGPASSTDSALAVFDLTTGKLIKEGAVPNIAGNILKADGSDWVSSNTLPNGSTFKATDSDVDTATDDSKFVTALALKNSNNVPNVVPSTAGNIMQSNGSNWISALQNQKAQGSTATIATGAFTATGDYSFYRVTAEASATVDELDTITLGAGVVNGHIITLIASTGTTITLTTLGNINKEIVITEENTATLRYSSGVTKWEVIGTNSASGGGGISEGVFSTHYSDLPTSLGTVYTCPADTVALVKMCQLTNYTATPAFANVAWYDSSLTQLVYLAYQTDVTQGFPVNVILEPYLILEAGDYIQVQAETVTSITGVISVEEYSPDIFNGINALDVDISTTAEAIYTCPANYQARLKVVQVTNIDGATSAVVDAYVYDLSTTTNFYLTSQMSIPAKSAYNVIANEVILETGDILYMKCNTAGDASVSVSIQLTEV